MRCNANFMNVIPNMRGARVRSLLFLAALIALAMSVAGQAKHPFTFEDMMKLKRVGDPQVSPDGKWVIFSVVDVDLAANTKIPHIWIVPLDQKAASSPTSGGLGMTSEREIIADQDADRPRWAPDGKRFAFLSTREGGSQVWIADFDAATGTVTHKVRWTSLATEASGELWSPDGKNILFTSDVYPECDIASDRELECNAKKLEEHDKSKVKALIFEHLLYRHWNAYKEGKRAHIFVVSTTPAEAMVGSVEPNSRLKLVSFRAQPNQAQQQSRPLAQQEPVLPGHGKVVTSPPPPRDLTPGDFDAPVFSLGGQDNYAFSPDGQEICYTSNHDKNLAASTNNDLWIVPVNEKADAFTRLMNEPSTGQNNYVAEVLAHTKNITADNPASDSSPLYSPDGRYIAYRAQQRPGYESDRFRLMLYDRKAGEKKNLTESLNRWVGTFTWSPDSERIYFSYENAGNALIGVWPLSVPASAPGTDVVPRIAGSPHAHLFPFDDDPNVSPDGKTLLFTSMSLRHPTEIYVDSLSDTGPPINGQTVKPLTHINDALLSQIDMSPLEPFWFTGAHGDKVEGFLVKPPNFDAAKKYPVKFLIHGGPEGAWGDDWSYRWNPELFASPTSSTPSGYVVIMINFHGSTGYGQKFIDAINGDWGGAPFEDLMKGLDYAEQTHPFIDKNRECALGASYGGYMANWILGHTDRFKCIVSHDGMFNAEAAWGDTEELWFNDWEFKGTPYDNRELYRKWSPHEYAKNFKTPTLVVHGQRDYRLDVSQGFDLFTTLQMEGVPSKMLYFPDEGHWVLKPQNSQLWYKTVNDWVDEWIGDKTTGDRASGK